MGVDSEYLEMWRRYLAGYPHDVSIIPLESALVDMAASRLRGEKTPYQTEIAQMISEKITEIKDKNAHGR